MIARRLFLPMLVVGALVAAGCPGSAPDAGPADDGGPGDAGGDGDGDGDGDALDGGPSDGGSPSDAGGIAGDGGAAPSLCDEPATGPNEYEHQIHHFTGDGVEVWLTREYEGQGAGITSVWGASRMTVHQGDVDACITDPADLDYDWTHHNWYDTARARIDGLEFVLHVELDLMGDGTFTTTLERRAVATDELLAGPFVLEHSPGSVWP